MLPEICFNNKGRGWGCSSAGMLIVNTHTWKPKDIRSPSLSLSAYSFEAQLLPTLLETSKPQQVTGWCSEARLTVWVPGFELSTLMITEHVLLAAAPALWPRLPASHAIFRLLHLESQFRCQILLYFLQAFFSLSFSKASEFSFDKPGV